MAKVKYYAKENTKVGTHSFYAVPVPNGTLTFNEVREEACRNTSIEPSIMKAAVAEYMKTVQSNVLKGYATRQQRQCDMAGAQCLGWEQGRHPPVPC